jgi:hypothetical protein
LDNNLLAKRLDDNLKHGFGKNFYLIFVDIEIINETLAIRCYSTKSSRREDRPGNISNRTLKVKRKKSSLTVLAPNFDKPIVGRREEDIFVELIPLDGADGHAVRLPAAKILGRIRCRAFVNDAFFRADKENGAFIRVKCDGDSACLQDLVIFRFRND